MPRRRPHWRAARCPAFASVLLVLLASACAPPPTTQPAPASARIAAARDDDVPPSSATYSSEATGAPLLGGPLATAVERQLLEALRPLGMSPSGDGKLALVAQWAARHLVRGMTPDLATLDVITRRVGYVGPTPWLNFFPMKGDTDAPVGADDLKRAVDSLPTNMPLTRYGIATISLGDSAQIVVATGSMEVALQPVPKQLGVRGQLHLTGTIADRFDHGRLAITLPGGQVRSWDSTARAVSGDFVATTAGVHRIELLGDGRSGPVVVANFPV